MNKYIKIPHVILVLFVASCSYYHDKLKVTNGSEGTICYETALFDKDTKRYILGPASDCIEGSKTKSPIVKASLRNRLLVPKFDSTLYICVLIKERKVAFMNNPDSFISNSSFGEINTLKLTLKQLDSLNWNIVIRN